MESQLGDSLDLNELAKVAGLSSYHFHRVWKALVGESVYQYVKRIRLERGANTLKNTELPVAEVAAHVGYESPEAFTRAFGQRFGCSPSVFRQEQREIQATRVGALIRERLATRLTGVQLEHMPERRMYTRMHEGPYQEIGPAWRKLMNSVRFTGVPVLASRALDDPDITERSFTRTLLCVGAETAEPIVKDLEERVVEEGLFAVYIHKGPYEGLVEAYDLLFGFWLLESEYVLRNDYAIEYYLNDVMGTPPDELLTKVCMPVTRV